MESTFAPLKRSRVVALSDGDLMRRVGRADPVAFEVFCDRHRVAAFCLAVRTCRSRVAAEDVMQEALLALWREAPRFDPARGTPRSWVLAMVHHRAIDAVRKLGVHERRWAGEGSADHLQDLRADVDRQVAMRGDAAIVRTALSTLPDDQRRALELSYYGGWTHAQIADRLGVPLGTVKGRVRLGLQKLNLALTGVALGGA